MKKIKTVRDINKQKLAEAIRLAMQAAVDDVAVAVFSEGFAQIIKKEISTEIAADVNKAKQDHPHYHHRKSKGIDDIRNLRYRSKKAKIGKHKQKVLSYTFWNVAKFDDTPIINPITQRKMPRYVSGGLDNTTMFADWLVGDYTLSDRPKLPTIEEWAEITRLSRQTGISEWSFYGNLMRQNKNNNNVYPAYQYVTKVYEHMGSSKSAVYKELKNFYNKTWQNNKILQEAIDNRLKNIGI